MSEYHDGNSNTPVSPKVTASTTTGAATVVILYLLGQVDFIATWPEPVKGALMVLITAAFVFVSGYLKRDPLRRRS